MKYWTTNSYILCAMYGENLFNTLSQGRDHRTVRPAQILWYIFWRPLLANSQNFRNSLRFLAFTEITDLFSLLALRRIVLNWWSKVTNAKVSDIIGIDRCCQKGPNANLTSPQVDDPKGWKWIDHHKKMVMSKTERPYASKWDCPLWVFLTVLFWLFMSFILRPSSLSLLNRSLSFKNALFSIGRLDRKQDRLVFDFRTVYFGRSFSLSKHQLAVVLNHSLWFIDRPI